VSEAELLDDLRSVSKLIGSPKVSQPLYEKHGQFDGRNLSRRFGTWNKALLAAGLTLSNEIDISDDRLFENILVLWQHYGRQPRRAELSHHPSSISQSPYRRRFQSWIEALRAFAVWANASEGVDSGSSGVARQPNIVRGSRDPSLRLRFKVMLRDRFTCRHCGASPSKDPNVELHVDHVVPWSKGGDTALENLQTLCLKCNLGKSNTNEHAD
jgi:hypothetical protein